MNSLFKILLQLVARGSISKMIEIKKPFPENFLKNILFKYLKAENIYTFIMLFIEKLNEAIFFLIEMVFVNYQNLEDQR